MMTFALPLAFSLLPLPLLVRLLPSARRGGGGWVQVPPSLAGRLPGGSDGGLARTVGLAPLVLLWLLLVTALAGPQILSTTALLPASGRDIILALDLSGSMEKEDFDLDGQPISRLDAVKRVAKAFITRRTGDRVGLVVFGDKAYVASPLTFDLAATAQAIEEAAIGVSGRSTSIGDGLGLTLKRLQESDSPARVVVLLSDGVSTAGSVPPREVGALAARMGVTVHTIALGPKDLETDPKARDAVDVATLRDIAETSGGTLFRVKTLADLVSVAKAIDDLEPSLSERPPLAVQRNYWTVPAALALVLCLILMATNGRRT